MREMKDSGIEWIGEIPKDWTVKRLKYCVQCLDGRRIPIDASQRKPGPYPYWGAGKIMDYIDDYIFDERLILLGEDGAPFFDPIRPVSHILNEKAWINNHIHVLKPNNDICDTYIVNCLNSVDYHDYIYGAILNKLTQGNMNNITIPFPASQEQQQIADFLDTKCSEIDATAEDIQKEISLLEDYKKSVIIEAVTKGLNPDAEMKDSGIEWIGEIPKHWVTIRIGNVFSLRNERNYLPMEQVQLLSLYSGKGVFPTGEEGTTNSGNHAQTVADYKIVKKNDIVVNIILAWMGSLGISNYNGVVSPAYDVYIPNEEKVVPHYYHYVFRTSGIANECYRYGRGIMMMRWRTYSSEFKRIHVPFPPLEEQQQIANYLDSKCSEIDTLIADKQRQLDILAEYKKSLIYEYVTGKKEVPVNE